MFTSAYEEPAQKTESGNTAPLSAGGGGEGGPACRPREGGVPRGRRPATPHHWKESPPSGKTSRATSSSPPSQLFFLDPVTGALDGVAIKSLRVEVLFTLVQALMDEKDDGRANALVLC